MTQVFGDPLVSAAPSRLMPGEGHVCQEDAWDGFCFLLLSVHLQGPGLPGGVRFSERG